MPIYEYECECGDKRDEFLSFADYDTPQVCSCGEVMRRKISLGNFSIKSTGNQMALDTLNDKHNGMPDKHWKADAERFASAGL